MKDIKIQIKSGNVSRDLNNPRVWFKNIPKVLENFNLIQSNNPDFFIYFDKRAPSGKFVKIDWAQEYKITNMATCDYALGWQYEDQITSPKYLRFSNYKFNNLGTELIKPPTYNSAEILKQKTKFCAFVYWHAVPNRIRFFEQLSKYKRVDSPGPCHTNCPPIGTHPNAVESRLSPNFYQEKVEWLKQYKFVIAFENRSAVGYTSEKIYNVMQADSIPIYWGNPHVHRDFNPKSFINAHDTNAQNEDQLFDYLIDQVIQLDKDDDLYVKTLQQPWYPNNQITSYANPDVTYNFFASIFNSK